MGFFLPFLFASLLYTHISMYMYIHVYIHVYICMYSGHYFLFTCEGIYNYSEALFWMDTGKAKWLLNTNHSEIPRTYIMY